MLKITTPCFVEGGWIPDYYAGFGEDQSPERWTGPRPGVQSILCLPLIRRKWIFRSMLLRSVACSQNCRKITIIENRMPCWF